ncbi:MAG: DUF4430 domain-containing protein [Lachnospiraceae bacterium]|nr:DUF4430 domain-containing protein [Lachnospiraceae bacterium]
MRNRHNKDRSNQRGLRQQRQHFLYLLLSLILLVCAACGGGSSADQKEGAANQLAETNVLPEDGIITKKQFAGVAGKDMTVSFEGSDGDISYTWTFDCKQIQNPEDQNLKIDFNTENLDSIKDAANHAVDALQMTLHGKGVICVPTLTVNLPGTWKSDTGVLVKEQNKALARISDVAISTDASSTTLTMKVTTLDGDSYVVGGISNASGSPQNGDPDIANGGKTQPGPADPGNSDSAGKSDGSGNPDGKLTCTVSINCQTLLNHMDELPAEKAEFVPSDGWILKETEMEFKEGDSAFDVLQAVTRENKIHLESSFTPAYHSAYIEGINQLYEFDCGDLSGWMYKVNGWFPNYGCSNYTLSDGDVVEWVYTCSLGQDVGDNSMY